MFINYFSRQILFPRTFHDSPVNSSTFQAFANSGIQQTTLLSEAQEIFYPFQVNYEEKCLHFVL